MNKNEKNQSSYKKSAQSVSTTSKKSEDSVNSNRSPSVNPSKLLNWANETLHKLKLDKNHLQKTKKHKTNNTEVNSDSCTSKAKESGSSITEPSYSIKQSKGTVTYISETVTQSKKKKKKIKHVEIDDDNTENENVSQLSKNSTNNYKSKHSHNKTDSAINVKQRFGKISWSDGQEDIIYEQKVIPVKKKKKKDKDCEVGGKLIVVKDSEFLLEKKRKKHKERSHSISDDSGCALVGKNSENDESNLFNGSESGSGKKKKKKKRHELNTSDNVTVTDGKNKFHKEAELMLLNGNESIPEKKKKKKKEVQIDESSQERSLSTNGKPALEDQPRKCKNMDDNIDLSVDSEVCLKKGKSKRFKYHEETENLINEDDTAKKKEKYSKKFESNDELISVSKKEQKKTLLDNSSSSEVEHLLKKHKKKKHKDKIIPNENIEETKESYPKKNKKMKIYDGNEISHQEDSSLECKKKEKTKHKDKFGNHSSSNENKKNDFHNSKIYADEHTDASKIDESESNLNYTPKKKKRKKEHERGSTHNCSHDSNKVKKGRHNDDSKVQEYEEIYERIEYYETPDSVSSPEEESLKRKHKKKHQDIPEINLSTVIAHKKRRSSFSNTESEDSANKRKKTCKSDNLECQATSASHLQKVQSLSAENTSKFGPSPIFRLLMDDSYNRNHVCETCKNCNSERNTSTPINNNADNVVNMFDFSQVVVKTEPGIEMKKEYIEKHVESATVDTEVVNNVSLDYVTDVTIKEEPKSPSHGISESEPAMHSCSFQTDIDDRSGIDAEQCGEVGITETASTNEQNQGRLENNFANVCDDKITIKEEIVKFSYEYNSQSCAGEVENENSRLHCNYFPNSEIAIGVTEVSEDNVLHSVPNLSDDVLHSDPNVEASERKINVIVNGQNAEIEQILVNITNTESSAGTPEESDITNGNKYAEDIACESFIPIDVRFPHDKPIQQTAIENIFILHFTQVPKKFSKLSLSKLLRVPIMDIRMNPHYYDYKKCQNYVTIKFNTEQALERVLQYNIRKVKCASWFVNTIPVWRGQKTRNQFW